MPIRPLEVIPIARSKNGQAIGPHRQTPEELEKLLDLHAVSLKKGDLKTWRRCQAVLRYLEGVPVAILVHELGVVRGSVNRWFLWFNAQGAEGLRPRKAPGGAPRLNSAQQEELASLVDAGPQACGFTSGMWTGPMVAELIEKRFGVRYNHTHVPCLLHKLGFSVQRPRKRLARADQAAQATWLRERLPALKKKRPLAVG